MKPEATSTIAAAKLTLPDTKRDHIQGPADAPLMLLEYGDYECPYCGEAYPLIKAVQESLGDKLCFAFRNFPLTNMHPYAEHAAEAAEAAAVHGKFWEMHDMLFENQDSLEDENIVRYATALGIDARKLIAEVTASAYSGRVKEDFKAGVKAGVNGTPTLFFNGVRYDGPREVEAMVAALTNAR